MEYRINKSQGIFRNFGQLLALFPCKVGDYLRRAYYFLTLKKCAWDLSTSLGTFFSQKEAKIGEHVAIGAYCIIGKVVLGDDVLIASRVSLISGKYQHMYPRHSAGDLFKMAESSFQEIKIGRNCWIGEGAVVMADIGEDSVVAAGSVVFYNLPAGSKVAGNPARSIKFSN